jgi:hypothetical protein
MTFLGKIVLGRALSCLSQTEEDRLLDALDGFWEEMTPSERVAANEHAAALAEGRAALPSAQRAAANDSPFPRPVATSTASTTSSRLLTHLPRRQLWRPTTQAVAGGSAISKTHAA